MSHGEFLRRNLDKSNATEFVAQLAEDWRALDLPPKERAMLEYARQSA